MPDLESGAEMGRNKLGKCPSEMSISRSRGDGAEERCSSGLWRQSSTGGFRRRTGQNAVASCLAPSSPSRLSSVQQQQEPLLNLDDNDYDEQHRHDPIGCVPLRISPVSWLSSILSLASPSPSGPTTSADSEQQQHQHQHQRRLFIWRAIARRVLRQRLGRGGGRSIGRKGRSLPPDMAYDESSYAKNFDLGQESWLQVDEGFRRAALCEAQCRRSASSTAALPSLQRCCRQASLDPSLLTENL